MMIFALLALSVFLYRKSVVINRELKELHGIKDKIFSVVAHDLRSPVGTLMSILKLAHKSMMEPQTQSLLFKDISDRVDATYNLLDNLLRWSKSQMRGITPAPVYFDVHKESRAVTDSLQHIAATKAIILNNCI